LRKKLKSIRIFPASLQDQYHPVYASSTTPYRCHADTPC
jgi:hypothetical protein